MKSKFVVFPIIFSVLCLTGFVRKDFTATTAKVKAVNQPNIIYIMADDAGFGDFGFNGQIKIKTPNIDQMAKEGMVFKQYYSGSAVCAPSRAALMTGINTAHGHVRELSAWTASGNSISLLKEEVTVAEELKRAGYATAIIGKWGLDESGRFESDKTKPTGNALDQGFDFFYGYKNHEEAHHYYPEYIWRNNEKIALPKNVPSELKGEYSNDAFTREALNFIKSADKEKPFFLYLPYTVPHNEITVPEDSKKAYENLGWPKRQMTKGHYYHDAEGNTAYAGMISRLDRYVGEIISQLKIEGIDENTIVIFTSDNGPGFDNGFFDSNGPFRGRKLTLYEGGIRSPFVARWPGKIAPGLVTNQPAAAWDFLTTACELAGIKPSVKKVDGISYLPTLLGQTKDQKQHDYFYFEINESQGPIQAIVMGKWKGILAFEKPFELYDLENDIAETKNIAEQYPAIVQKIKKTFLSTRTENPEFPLTKRKSHYPNGG
jgi:arylsulfatase A